eukprot:jgi/Mesvir1/29425/Mv23005-RA.1
MAPDPELGTLVDNIQSIADNANKTGTMPDAIALYTAFSDLYECIAVVDKSILVQHQRRCEDALQAILFRGVPSPIRVLAADCICKLSLRGESISCYAQSSQFQGWLAKWSSKTAGSGDAAARIGVLHALGALFQAQGQKLGTGLGAVVTNAAKHVKATEANVREAAVRLLGNAIGGVGVGASAAALAETLKAIGRVVSDRHVPVRVAAAACLNAIASTGDGGLFVTGGFETCISLCVKGVEDAAAPVRDGFAAALGKFVALTFQPSAVAQVAQIKSTRQLAATKKMLEGAVVSSLVVPFCRASSANARNTRVALAMAWVEMFHSIQGMPDVDDAKLAELATHALHMLSPNLSGEPAAELFNPTTWKGQTGVMAHAQACVLYIVRVGVMERMPESGQKVLLDVLVKELSNTVEGIANDAMDAVALRLLVNLMALVGEVEASSEEALEEAMTKKLSSPVGLVRIEAALGVAALAKVFPGSTSRLISSGVDRLAKLRSKLEVKGDPQKLRTVLDALHGYALMISAILAALPQMPLGVPSSLTQSVLVIAVEMAQGASKSPAVRAAERGAAWNLLAALILCIPAEERNPSILPLWDIPFDDNALERLEVLKNNESTLVAEMCWWVAAMEALQALIMRDIQPLLAKGQRPPQLAAVLQHLTVALSMILSPMMSPSSTPNPAAPNTGHWVRLFTLRTLEAFRALPSASLYRANHAALLEICSAPFRDVTTAVATSLLDRMLDPTDAVLGPLVPGRDSLEDQLRAFEGGMDGLLPCLWNDGDSHAQFRLARPLAVELVDLELIMFGLLFSKQSTKHRQPLLALVQRAVGEAKRKEKYRMPNQANTCAGLLMAMRAAASGGAGVAVVSGRQSASASRQTPELTVTVQQIFQAVLSQDGIGPEHRRAAAEVLGLLARMGDDAYAAHLVRTSLKLAGSPGTGDNSIYALAVGCINRSVGGMTLSGLVRATVTELMWLAKVDAGKPRCIWPLHALWLTANVAGMSFMPHVTEVLHLLVSGLMLMEEETALYEQCVGRIVNAIVGVMGPELAPASTIFKLCRMLISQIKRSPAASAQLECVLYAQQLVLLAPQAVPAFSHIPMLRATLCSRQPALRAAAVVTLQHLVERDPMAMVPYRVEEDLFSALDSETDASIIVKVQGILKTMLQASAPTCPSRWVKLCSDVVLGIGILVAPADAAPNKPEDVAAAASSGKAAAASADDGKDRDDDDGDRDREDYDDDDEGGGGGNRGAARGGNASARDAGKRTGDQAAKAERAIPRLRTRLFAGECAVSLPSLVGEAREHFDLAAATERGAGKDWLVLHLADLVGLGYKVATGSMEALRPCGIALLLEIMRKFADTEDPDYEGHILLEQYQAQFVSALRSALEPSSMPLLAAAGAKLAATVIISRVPAGDADTLRRMMAIILKPLSNWEGLEYHPYSEWVGTKVRVELLKSLAIILAFSRDTTPAPKRSGGRGGFSSSSFRHDDDEEDDEGRSLLLEEMRPHLARLRTLWMSLLKDYTVARSNLPQVQSMYTPCIHYGPSVSAEDPVWDFLQAAWSPVLLALVPTPECFTRTRKPRLKRAATAKLPTVAVTTQPAAAAPSAPSLAKPQAASSVASAAKGRKSVPASGHDSDDEGDRHGGGFGDDDDDDWDGFESAKPEAGEDKGTPGMGGRAVGSSSKKATLAGGRGSPPGGSESGGASPVGAVMPANQWASDDDGEGNVSVSQPGGSALAQDGQGFDDDGFEEEEWNEAPPAEVTPVAPQAKSPVPAPQREAVAPVTDPIGTSGGVSAVGSVPSAGIPGGDGHEDDDEWNAFGQAEALPVPATAPAPAPTTAVAAPANTAGPSPPAEGMAAGADDDSEWGAFDQADATSAAVPAVAAGAAPTAPEMPAPAAPAAPGDDEWDAFQGDGAVAEGRVAGDSAAAHAAATAASAAGATDAATAGGDASGGDDEWGAFGEAGAGTADDGTPASVVPAASFNAQPEGPSPDAAGAFGAPAAVTAAVVEEDDWNNFEGDVGGGSGGVEGDAGGKPVGEAVASVSAEPVRAIAPAGSGETPFDDVDLSDDVPTAAETVASGDDDSHNPFAGGGPADADADDSSNPFADKRTVDTGELDGSNPFAGGAIDGTNPFDDDGPVDVALAAGDGTNPFDDDGPVGGAPAAGDGTNPFDDDGPVGGAPAAGEGTNPFDDDGGPAAAGAGGVGDGSNPFDDEPAGAAVGDGTNPFDDEPAGSAVAVAAVGDGSNPFDDEDPKGEDNSHNPFAEEASMGLGALLGSSSVGLGGDAGSPYGILRLRRVPSPPPAPPPPEDPSPPPGWPMDGDGPGAPPPPLPAPPPTDAPQDGDDDDFGTFVAPPPPAEEGTPPLGSPEDPEPMASKGAGDSSEGGEAPAAKGGAAESSSPPEEGTGEGGGGAGEEPAGGSPSGGGTPTPGAKGEEQGAEEGEDSKEGHGDRGQDDAEEWVSVTTPTGVEANGEERQGEEEGEATGTQARGAGGEDEDVKRGAEDEGPGADASHAEHGDAGAEGEDAGVVSGPAAGGDSAVPEVGADASAMHEEGKPETRDDGVAAGSAMAEAQGQEVVKEGMEEKATDASFEDGVTEAKENEEKAEGVTEEGEPQGGIHDDVPKGVQEEGSVVEGSIKQDVQEGGMTASTSTAELSETESDGSVLRKAVAGAQAAWGMFASDDALASEGASDPVTPMGGASAGIGADASGGGGEGGVEGGLVEEGVAMSPIAEGGPGSGDEGGDTGGALATMAVVEEGGSEGQEIPAVVKEVVDESAVAVSADAASTPGEVVGGEDVALHEVEAAAHDAGDVTAAGHEVDDPATPAAAAEEEEEVVADEIREPVELEPEPETKLSEPERDADTGPAAEVLVEAEVQAEAPMEADVQAEAPMEADVQAEAPVTASDAVPALPEELPAMAATTEDLPEESVAELPKGSSEEPPEELPEEAVQPGENASTMVAVPPQAGDGDDWGKGGDGGDGRWVAAPSGDAAAGGVESEEAGASQLPEVEAEMEARDGPVGPAEGEREAEAAAAVVEEGLVEGHAGEEGRVSEEDVGEEVKPAAPVEASQVEDEEGATFEGSVVEGEQGEEVGEFVGAAATVGAAGLDIHAERSMESAVDGDDDARPSMDSAAVTQPSIDNAAGGQPSDDATAAEDDEFGDFSAPVVDAPVVEAPDLELQAADGQESAAAVAEAGAEAEADVAVAQSIEELAFVKAEPLQPPAISQAEGGDDWGGDSGWVSSGAGLPSVEGADASNAGGGAIDAVQDDSSAGAEPLPAAGDAPAEGAMEAEVAAAEVTVVSVAVVGDASGSDGHPEGAAATATAAGDDDFDDEFEWAPAPEPASQSPDAMPAAAAAVTSRGGSFGGLPGGDAGLAAWSDSERAAEDGEEKRSTVSDAEDKRSSAGEGENEPRWSVGEKESPWAVAGASSGAKGGDAGASSEEESMTNPTAATDASTRSKVAVPVPTDDEAEAEERDHVAEQWRWGGAQGGAGGGDADASTPTSVSGSVAGRGEDHGEKGRSGTEGGVTPVASSSLSSSSTVPAISVPGASVPAVTTPAVAAAAAVAAPGGKSLAAEEKEEELEPELAAAAAVLSAPEYVQAYATALLLLCDAGMSQPAGRPGGGSDGGAMLGVYSTPARMGASEPHLFAMSPRASVSAGGPGGPGAPVACPTVMPQEQGWAFRALKWLLASPAAYCEERFSMELCRELLQMLLDVKVGDEGLLLEIARVARLVVETAPVPFLADSVVCVSTLELLVSLLWRCMPELMRVAREDGAEDEVVDGAPLPPPHPHREQGVDPAKEPVVAEGLEAVARLCERSSNTMAVEIIPRVLCFSLHLLHVPLSPSMVHTVLSFVTRVVAASKVSAHAASLPVPEQGDSPRGFMYAPKPPQWGWQQHAQVVAAANRSVARLLETAAAAATYSGAREPTLRDQQLGHIPLLVSCMADLVAGLEPVEAGGGGQASEVAVGGAHVHGHGGEEHDVQLASVIHACGCLVRSFHSGSDETKLALLSALRTLVMETGDAAPTPATTAATTTGGAAQQGAADAFATRATAARHSAARKQFALDGFLVLGPELLEVLRTAPLATIEGVPLTLASECIKTVVLLHSLLDADTSADPATKRGALALLLHTVMHVSSVTSGSDATGQGAQVLAAFAAKLVMHVATNSAAAFKEFVAELSVDMRQRLQAVLRAALQRQEQQQQQAQQQQQQQQAAAAATASAGRPGMLAPPGALKAPPIVVPGSNKLLPPPAVTVRKTESGAFMLSAPR